MFRVDMMPAAHGDCLWVEYGDPDDPRRVLVDAGPTFNDIYQVLVDRIRALPTERRHFELFVVTHVDADHIGGAIRLMRDAPALGLTFDRIWFNGFDELRAHPRVGSFLGAAQGEYLNLLIGDYETRTGTTVHNAGFDGPILVDDDGLLRVIELPGGLSLTVLSPGVDELIGLAIEWKAVVEELGFRSDAGPLATIRDQLEASTQLRPLVAAVDAGPAVLGPGDGADAAESAPPIPPTFGIEVLGSEVALGSDDSPANGSSIALLAEHADGSALLAGDAFAPRLAASLRTLLAARGSDRLRVDCFKLPHHGSAGNVSVELLDLISTKHYLVSTSGAQFGHPHATAIDAVIEHHHGARGKPELWFNHDTETTRPWRDRAGATTHYPQGGTTWRA